VPSCDRAASWHCRAYLYRADTASYRALFLFALHESSRSRARAHSALREAGRKRAERTSSSKCTMTVATADSATRAKIIQKERLTVLNDLGVWASTIEWSAALIVFRSSISPASRRALPHAAGHGRQFDEANVFVM
jgi:hypothetical protein